MPDECIFCAIASHRSPAHVLWEDDLTMAFLDLFPLNRGHLLIIPKAHVDRLTDLPREHYTAMLGAVSEMCRRTERLSENYNVAVNQGAIAGQIVFHLHFHIIPRYRTGEGFPKTRTKLEVADARALVEILSNP